MNFNVKYQNEYLCFNSNDLRFSDILETLTAENMTDREIRCVFQFLLWSTIRSETKVTFFNEEEWTYNFISKHKRLLNLFFYNFNKQPNVSKFILSNEKPKKLSQADRVLNSRGERDGLGWLKSVVFRANTKKER